MIERMQQHVHPTGIQTARHGALAGGLILALIALSACAPGRPVSIERALSDKLITATLKSRGTYGDIVIAAVTSQTDEAIELTIARGTLLKNSTAGSENLVVYGYKGLLSAPDSNIYQTNASFTLRSKGAVTYAMVEAYSVNALAGAATLSDTFSISGTAGNDVSAVLAVATDSDSIEAKQIAVWVVTDDVTAAEMQAVQFQHTPADVNAARTILLRAKIDVGRYRLFAGNG